MTFKITLVSCDGYRETRRFKTLKGAQKFAHDHVGETPEIGCGYYAVSDDGIATIRTEGCTLRQIFPKSF